MQSCLVFVIFLSCVYVLFTFYRFVPDKEFSGTHTRDGPVQFEKAVEEDPFGLNQFLTEAKKAKRPSDRLDQTYYCDYARSLS